MAIFNIIMDAEMLGNWIAYVTVMITILFADLMYRWITPMLRKKKRG
jgi:peptidoglycan/LPS O-acetylase OafA/YrhL